MKQEIAKWEDRGMLDGLDETRKTNCACLLENEDKYLKSSISDINLRRIFVPMMRRLYGNDKLNIKSKVMPKNAKYFEMKTEVPEYFVNVSSYVEQGCYSLDAEQEKASNLALNLSEEINGLKGDKNLTVYRLELQDNKIVLRYDFE